VSRALAGEKQQRLIARSPFVDELHNVAHSSGATSSLSTCS